MYAKSDVDPGEHTWYKIHNSKYWLIDPAYEFAGKKDDDTLSKKKKVKTGVTCLWPHFNPR